MVDVVVVVSEALLAPTSGMRRHSVVGWRRGGTCDCRMCIRAGGWRSQAWQRMG